MNEEKIIQDHLNRIDYEDVVRDEVREIIYRTVEATINRELQDIFEKVADTLITKYLEEKFQEFLSKEIVINDGWTTSTRYESFDEFFKEALKKKFEQELSEWGTLSLTQSEMK